MAFSKVFEGRLWGVTNQNADVRLTVGDSSGGTFTARAHPMRGTLVWDYAMYVLEGVSVAGGATGGSYTITLETDAVVGYTGLPIAGVSGIGPNTRGRVVFTNLHRSPGSPLPTHINIDQTATGGGIWFQTYAFAKQYRGTLGTPGINTSERVLQGTMIRGTSYSGGPFTSAAGFDADETIAVGASFSDLGMRRIRLWDRAFYWAQAGNSISGTHDVDIIATVNGATFTVASTVGVNGGPLSAANERLPLQSNFFGQSPNPSHLIWTEVTTGGVSDARVICLAKTGRGSLAKS